MDSTVTLFEPDSILRSTVRVCIKPDQKLGGIVPVEDQQAEIGRRWSLQISNESITGCGTPYGQGGISQLEAAAHRLKDTDVAYIALDCLGYSESMKQRVQQITGKPVITPRTLVARIIPEVV